MNVRKVVLFLLCCFTLSGCVKYERTCEDISLAKLRPLIGQELPPDFEQWISRVYDVSSEDVRISQSAEISQVAFHWTSAGVTYTALFVHSIFEAASVTYGSSPPTGNNILECLGEPELYRAWYHYSARGRLEFNLRLVFVDEGISTLASIFRDPSEKAPPHVDGTITFMYFAVVKPDTVEEMMGTLFRGYAEEELEQTLQNLKPWPGSWDQIVVDVAPGLEE